MQLTEKQKYDIVLRSEKGETTVKIAKEMNISRKTVSKWLNRYRKTNKVSRKKGTGIRK